MPLIVLIEYLIVRSCYLSGLVMMTLTLTMPAHAAFPNLDCEKMGFDVQSRNRVMEMHRATTWTVQMNILDNLGQMGYLFFWCGIESSLYFFVDRTYLIEYSYVGAGWLGMMLIDAFIPQREQLASKPLASTIHNSPYMYDHIHGVSEADIEIVATKDNTNFRPGL
jgi:hypothetical protein